MLIFAGRSREGAWIEIKEAYVDAGKALGRSREGAWIEIAGDSLCGNNIPRSLP